MSDIVRIVLSPDGRFVGGSYDFFIGEDSDFGIFVINPRTDRKEVFGTDNTITLDDEIECRIPELQAMADRLAWNYVKRVFPDLGIPQRNVTGEIEIAGEDSGNSLSFIGWNGLQSFVARYDLLADVEVVVTDPPIRLPYDIGPIPRIEGILHYQRTADGSWTVDGCPGLIAAVLPWPVPVRDLTLSADGKLMLDGSELAHSIAEGAAMEVHPVTHLSGPINR